MIFEDIVRNK